MNVVDGERSSVGVIDVAVVASSGFPQIRGRPSLISCSLGRTLFHRFEDIGHIVNLFEGMDEYVNVIGHEHISEDGKIEFHRGPVDSIDEEFADAVVVEVRLLVIG